MQPTFTLIGERVLDGYSIRLRGGLPADTPRPALCLIHGLGEGWEVWSALCSRLAQRYQLFCLELPWSGSQGPRWGQLRPPSAWLRSGLELLPEPPRGLVAHSFGANAALELLQDGRPPALDALVLVSPFYLAPSQELDWQVFQQTLQRFRQVMAQGVAIRQQRRGSKNRELLAAMGEKVVEWIGPLGFMEFFALFARTPALRLEQIGIPALILAGADDITASAESNIGLADRLPGSRVATLPGCGHFCMLEQPDLCADAVGQYLGAIPAPRGRAALT